MYLSTTYVQVQVPSTTRLQFTVATTQVTTEEQQTYSVGVIVFQNGVARKINLFMTFNSFHQRTKKHSVKNIL